MPQSFGFDLADALARDVELLADLFERVLALAADPEPQPDDLLFFRRQGFQDAAVSSRTLPSITASTGDPTQRSSIKSPCADSPSRPTGVSSETGFARNGFQFLHFLHRNVHAPPDLFIGGRPGRPSASSPRVRVE